MNKNSLRKQLGNSYTVTTQRFNSNKQTGHFSGNLNLTSETIRNLNRKYTRLNQYSGPEFCILVQNSGNLGVKVPKFCVVDRNVPTFSSFRRVSKSSVSLFKVFERNLKTPVTPLQWLCQNHIQVSVCLAHMCWSSVFTVF